MLDDLVCLSLPVARIWGFNDSKDASSIRRSPEEGFREEGLRGLDQAVWEAKRRGIRLVIPLVNNWGEYGGLPAYAAWASKAFGGTYTHDDFFTNPQMKQWWKDYVYMLVNRVNTFTGVAYKDEPAILAWEIGERAALPELPRHDGASSTRSTSWRRSSSSSRPTSSSPTAATASTTTRRSTKACRTSTPCAATRARATRSSRASRRSTC